MKIKLLSILLLLSGILAAQAFTGRSDKKLQGGFAPYGYGTGIVGTFDYGFHEMFSAGAGAEFYFDNEGDDPEFYINGRINLHLGESLELPSNMDIYPGLDLGIAGDDIGLGAHVGFRYFFNYDLGAYVELGTRGSIGISYNF